MNHFFAYIDRMRYIERWALMRNSVRENIQEHSHQVAVLAHALAVIRNELFGGQVDAGEVAAAALYHDAGEILTGDMPTPVKYSSPGLRDAYKALEAESVASMTRLLPPELAEEVSPFISGSLLTAEEKRLLKAADRLSALVKCMEEQRSGNHEFDAALRQQQEALEGMHCPEADWFMAHCLPCFTQNLDELTRSE